MKRAKLNTSTDEGYNQERYLLQLFITGTTPNSTRAIQDTRAFCKANLDNSYELEVVDLYQNPEQAGLAQISVTPTLVKKHPLPMRKLVGDLSDPARIIARLDIGVGPGLLKPKPSEHDS